MVLITYAAQDSLDKVNAVMRTVSGFTSECENPFGTAEDLDFQKSRWDGLHCGLKAIYEAVNDEVRAARAAYVHSVTQHLEPSVHERDLYMQK